MKAFQSLDLSDPKRSFEYVGNCHDEEILVVEVNVFLHQDEVGIQGVSVGAVLSDYQRVRVENV